MPADSQNPGARATHLVMNQPPALVRYNLYDRDIVLRRAVRREGAEWAEEQLSRFGSTSCKALYRCRDCREPFDYFKVL